MKNFINNFEKLSLGFESLVYGFMFFASMLGVLLLLITIIYLLIK